MKLFATKSWIIAGAFLVVGLLLCATTANAGLMPPDGQGGGPPADFPGITMRMNGNGNGNPHDHIPPGFAKAQGNYGYQGQGRFGNFDVTWDIEVNPDPFIFGVFTITNTGSEAEDYNLNTILPISPPLTGGILTGGSLSGSLMDASQNGDGATLSQAGGASLLPMYMARIDGGDYYSLNPTSLPVVAPARETTSFPPVNFGTPIPSLFSSREVLKTIEIELNASLSPGAVATIMATFYVEPVPEPSTLVLLSMGILGSLVLRGRRRRR